MSRISLFVLGITLSGLALAAAPPPKSNTLLIEELDDDEFEVRERASRALVERDLRATTALERALVDRITLEQRHRIQRALTKIYSSAREPAHIRAVVALTGELRTAYSQSLTRDLVEVLDQIVGQISKDDVARLRRYEAATEFRHDKAEPLAAKLRKLEEQGIHSGKEYDALKNSLASLAEEITALEKAAEKIYVSAIKQTNLKYNSSTRNREFGLAASYRAGTVFQVSYGDRSVVVVAGARGFRAFEEVTAKNLLAPPRSLSFFESEAFKNLDTNVDADKLTPQSKLFQIDAVRGRAGQRYYKVSMYGGAFCSDKPAILALKMLNRIWKEEPAVKLPTVAELPKELLEPIFIPVGKSKPR